MEYNTISQSCDDGLLKYLDNDAYDKYITDNIILIDLKNASANNSILEMIVTNTPFFVNRLSPVEDYLGKNYPLYFKEITEIENIINNKALLLKKYKITHDYLVNLDKSDITYEHFNSELLRIINI